MRLSTKIYKARITIVAVILYIFLVIGYLISVFMIIPDYNETDEYIKYNIKTKSYTEYVHIKQVDLGYDITGVPFRRIYFYTAGNGIRVIDTKDIETELAEGMLLESSVTDILLYYGDTVVTRRLQYNTFLNELQDITQIKQDMQNSVIDTVAKAEKDYFMAVLKNVLIGLAILTFIYLIIQSLRIRVKVKRYEEARILKILEETENG